MLIVQAMATTLMSVLSHCVRSFSPSLLTRAESLIPPHAFAGSRIPAFTCLAEHADNLQSRAVGIRLHILNLPAPLAFFRAVTPSLYVLSCVMSRPSARSLDQVLCVRRAVADPFGVGRTQVQLLRGRPSHPCRCWLPLCPELSTSSTSTT